MFSFDSSTIKEKNSYMKYSENNVNIPIIENKNKLITSKLRTKSCDVKRRFFSKINIEKNRMALLDAMNINKEVIKITNFILFYLVKREIEKID